MQRSTALSRLTAFEPELRAMGVSGLSLFGSVARDEAGPASDVDIVVRLDETRNLDLIDSAQINLRLQEMLGAKVDLVTEPARKPRFQAQIDRDRVHAF